MKRATYIFILLLFVTISLKAQSGITTLANKAAFETAVRTNERVVVIFAAEWCDYCKAFLPKVEKIASDYEEIKFFKINYDENIAFFQAEGIKATPTVKRYRNGVETDKMVTINVESLQENLRDF